MKDCGPVVYPTNGVETGSQGFKTAVVTCKGENSLGCLMDESGEGEMMPRSGLQSQACRLQHNAYLKLPTRLYALYFLPPDA